MDKVVMKRTLEHGGVGGGELELYNMEHRMVYIYYYYYCYNNIYHLLHGIF